MSLNKFSAAIQKHLKTGSTTQTAELQQFEKLRTDFNNSFSTNNKTLRDVVSVLESDIETGFADNPYTTEFRKKGMQAGNNKFVVTENTLVEMFKRYGLTKPSDYTSLILFFNDWLEKTSRRFNRNNAAKGRFTEQVETFSDDTDDKKVYATRIANIPHTATADLLYNFLKYRSEKPRKKGNLPSRAQFGKDYQIGHIESQSSGRVRISSNTIPSKTLAGGKPEDLINYLISLTQYLDLASSSMLPNYDKLVAAITKDFEDTNIYMNVELQPTGLRSLKAGNQNLFTNQGSAALGQALAITRLLTASVTERHDERTVIDINTDLEKIKNSMQQLHDAYIANKAHVQSTLKNFKGMPPRFLANLESSDTVRDFIKNMTIAILDPSSQKKPRVKVKHSNVPVQTLDNSKAKQLKTGIDRNVKGLTQKLKTLGSKLKSKTAKASKNLGTLESGPPAQLRTTTGQFYGLVPLQRLLDASLVQQVKDNMGTGSRRDILNLRSGRFAESVRVERLSQSREGMITAFYNYMRNPYATFSQGGRQEFPKTRDPKLLIAKSIREIGATMVANRMRAVLV